MLQPLWSIVSAWALALLAAIAIAVATGVPIAVSPSGDGGRMAVETSQAIAAFSLPGAIIAIALSEARRVRGIVYWLFAGLAIGVAGWALLPPLPSPSRFSESGRFAIIAGMGLVAGYVYYARCGRRSGYLAAAVQRRTNGRA